jgi:hypothetical protein
MKIMKILGVITLVALLAGSLPLLGGINSSFAQYDKYESITPELAEQLMEIYQQKLSLTPVQKKIDSHIWQVSRKVKERVSASKHGEKLDLRDLSTPPLKVDQAGNIKVKLNVRSLSEAQLDEIKDLGMDVTFSSPEYGLVEGSLPYNRVEAIAGLDFIKNVQTPGIPMYNTGDVTSAGDTVLRAAAARSAFGVDGSGSKIGVISDGVTHLTNSVATGDLPSSPAVHVVKLGTGDEGTAILEIIHDLAPGAELAFYGPDPNSSGDMATGILALEAAGCNIIVDDLIWSDEPKFEDGPIAQTARGFIERGGMYTSSAGNGAQRHYQAQYNRDGTKVVGERVYHAHDYGSGDKGNTFTVPSGHLIYIFLQWNNQWGASGDDFDLFLFSGNNTIKEKSWDVQDGDDDPWEWLYFYNNTEDDIEVWIGIFERSLVSLPEDMILDYHVWYSTGLEYVTPEDSVIGHAAVEEVLSTAAADASTPDVIEDFSSHGPATVFFPTYEERQVPNITGVDGVQTKTGQLGYFSNPFDGTSASAPHVAAIAALVWEANPALTSAEVFDAITSTALDRPPAGWDGTWGYGLADALGAVTSVMNEGIGLRVMNRDGLPASGARVLAYADTSDYPTADNTTDGSGFTFLDVPDGDYTLAISSETDNFFIVKTVAAPSNLTIYAADETVPVDIVASKLDGSPIVDGYIDPSISKAWPQSIGRTDVSGECMVYLTPLTYGEILLTDWEWGNPYYLYLPDITVPETGLSLNFTAANMPTGMLLVDLVDFPYASFVLWLQEPHYVWSAPSFTVEDGDSIVLSESGYEVTVFLKKPGVEDQIWYFILEEEEVSITSDSQVTFTDGGSFNATVESREPSYNAGDTVNLDVLISDNFSNRLCQSCIYTPPDYQDVEESPEFYQDRRERDLNGCCETYYNFPYPENNPTITVTDPDGAVFVEESSRELFCDYGFDLPNDATPGIWTANVSFDTGPHQGVIEDTTTFSVGGEYICGDVNSDGKVNMADVMILWYDIADYPSAGAWTIAKEWAADVNCDSKVNMADVMILWYDIADYPSAGAWEVNCCAP